MTIRHATMRAAGLLALAPAALLIDPSSGFQLSMAKRRTVTSTIETKITMTTTSTDNALPSNSDHILFDMPVSNNGARCRIILYKKSIPKEKVDIISPMALGGLKSEEYMKRSPQGLMPCLAIQKEDNPYGISSLAESDT